MKALGIDPGYDRCGMAIVSRSAQTGKDSVIWSDCTQTDKKHTYFERFGNVCSLLENAISTHKPDIIAIETLFFNQNTSTALKVAEVRGAILHLAHQNNIAVVEISPQEVKIAVTGVGNATKDAVARMIPKIALIHDATKKRLDDELDAISVAIAGLSHHKSHKALA